MGNGPGNRSEDTPFDRFIARIAQRLSAFDRGALATFGGRRFETEMSIEQSALRSQFADLTRPATGIELGPRGTAEFLAGGDCKESSPRWPSMTFRQVIMPSGAAALAEIATTPTGARSVRLLELSWNDHTTQFVTEIYGLSEAEVRVCRAFLALCDLKAVAAERGTSEGTVRQQLKSIFAKTSTRNQAQLVRSLAIICARTRALATTRLWSDPFGRERLFFDTEGRQVAFTQLGAENGRPAVLVHGPLTGYVVHDEIEEGLRRANITLWAVSRPGFGNSEPDPDRPAIDAGARAIEAMMDHLGIAACPGIGIICGLAPLARLAAQQPERLTLLIGIGGAAPLIDAHRRRRLPPLQRVFTDLAILSPNALEVVFLHALHAVAEHDLSFVLRRMYGQCPPDIACVLDADVLRRLVEGARMILARDPKVFLRDLQMMSHPWADDLRRANVPCRMLCGDADPVFPPAVVERIGARTEILPGAGQLVAFQHPGRVLAAIKDAVA